MTRKTTLRSELRWYLLGLVGLIVLIYTIQLRNYFIRGIELAAQAELEFEGRYYLQQYRIDPNAVLPTGPHLTSFLTWDDAPEDVRTLFPIETHEPGKVSDNESPLANDTDETWFLFLPYPIGDNRFLYLVKRYEPDTLTDRQSDAFYQALDLTWPLAAAFLAVSLFLMQNLGRRVSRSTHALSEWADQMALEPPDTHPNFYYSELNSIADHLLQGFRRVNETLAREHRFLSYASHELRTPIAVTRANLDLIDKLGVPLTISESVVRIRRANQGMQQLTETLLWLSRETATDLPRPESVDVPALVRDLVEDSQYLIEGKDVEVLIDVTEHCLELKIPATPFRIVLANLIRNAMQHTHEGNVRICVTPTEFSIANTSSTLDHSASPHRDDQGLGLSLVQQLCERIGLSLQLSRESSGMFVAVRWHTPKRCQ